MIARFSITSIVAVTAALLIVVGTGQQASEAVFPGTNGQIAFTNFDGNHFDGDIICVDLTYPGIRKFLPQPSEYYRGLIDGAETTQPQAIPGFTVDIRLRVVKSLIRRGNQSGCIRNGRYSLERCQIDSVVRRLDRRLGDASVIDGRSYIGRLILRRQRTYVHDELERDS